MVLGYRNGMIGGDDGEYAVEEDTALPIYGLATGRQLRPFEVVDWEAQCIYVPEDSLFVNGQKVFIQLHEDEEYFIRDGDFIKRNPVVIRKKDFFVRIEVGSAWEMDQRKARGSIDFCAYLVIAPLALDKRIGEGKNNPESADIFRSPDGEIFNSQPKIAVKDDPENLYCFDVAYFPDPSDSVGYGNQYAYGQIQLNGLKNKAVRIPFEMNVVLSVYWNKDRKKYMCSKTYEMYVPKERSVQVNGVLLPFMDKFGGEFLEEDTITIEPNVDYWCYVTSSAAIITTTPVKGKRGFYIGQIMDPQPYEGTIEPWMT